MMGSGSLIGCLSSAATASAAAEAARNSRRFITAGLLRGCRSGILTGGPRGHIFFRHFLQPDSPPRYPPGVRTTRVVKRVGREHPSHWAAKHAAGKVGSSHEEV